MIELEYTLHDKPLALSFEVYQDSFDHTITIDRMVQEDGSIKWAVRNHARQCLSTGGEWDYESMPSNRPEDWIATHRFDDFHTAWRKAKIAAREMLGAAEDRVRIINERQKQEREKAESE